MRLMSWIRFTCVLEIRTSIKFLYNLCTQTEQMTETLLPTLSDTHFCDCNILSFKQGLLTRRRQILVLARSLALVSILIRCKYRGDIKISLYMKFGWHPFDCSDDTDILAKVGGPVANVFSVPWPELLKGLICMHGWYHFPIKRNVTQTMCFMQLKFGSDIFLWTKCQITLWNMTIFRWMFFPTF